MTIQELTEEEIIKIATPIMDNLMEGSTEEDWAKHTLHFSDDVKARLTEEELLRQCKFYKSAFGDFDQRRLIGVTQHPHYVNVVWKQSMTKNPVNIWPSSPWCRMVTPLR